MSDHGQTTDGRGIDATFNDGETRDSGRPAYSIEEVALLLRVKPRSIEKIIVSGDLTAHSVGDKVVVYCSDLQRCIDKHTGQQVGGFCVPFTNILFGGRFTHSGGHKDAPGNT